MSQFNHKGGQSSTLGRRIHHRVSLLRRCILRALQRFLVCSGKKPGANATYSMLPPRAALPSPLPPLESTVESAPPPLFHTHELDTDLVSLKISLLGDCQIGKTSFLVSLSLFFYFILFKCTHKLKLLFFFS